MIGRIHGTLLQKNPPQLLVDCQGVGYEIDVPMSTFYNLPSARKSLFSPISLSGKMRISSTGSAVWMKERFSDS